jgi:hypothetical protein
VSHLRAGVLFPGNLWYLHALTGDKKWKVQAEIYTNKIESKKWNLRTDDLVFKMFGSLGNGWRLWPNATSK